MYKNLCHHVVRSFTSDEMLYECIIYQIKKCSVFYLVIRCVMCHWRLCFLGREKNWQWSLVSCLFLSTCPWIMYQVTQNLILFYVFTSQEKDGTTTEYLGGQMRSHTYWQTKKSAKLPHCNSYLDMRRWSGIPKIYFPITNSSRQLV